MGGQGTALIVVLAIVGLLLYGRGVFHAAWAAVWS